MKKNIVFIILTVFTIFLSISATFEFLKLISNFSISSKIELMFFIGFVFYLVIHIVFYRPVFMHVMAHELTHMLWAFLFGGKTKKLEVSASGGKVLVNRSNFMISLAPYFFPLYTFLILIIYMIAKAQYLSYIAFILGMSLSFHIALTLYSLKNDQSDFIEDSNIVFSIAFVYLMNIIVIAFILYLLSAKISFLTFLYGIFVNGWIILKNIFVWINELLK